VSERIVAGPPVPNQPTAELLDGRQVEVRSLHTAAARAEFKERGDGRARITARFSLAGCFEAMPAHESIDGRQLYAEQLGSLALAVLRLVWVRQSFPAPTFPQLRKLQLDSRRRDVRQEHELAPLNDAARPCDHLSDLLPRSVFGPQAGFEVGQVVKKGTGTVSFERIDNAGPLQLGFPDHAPPFRIDIADNTGLEKICHCNGPVSSRRRLALSSQRRATIRFFEFRIL
jgi:hypothetical protein